MAEMSFVIYTEDKTAEVENVISYEWLRDADAACDAVRLTFFPDKKYGEAQRLKAYYNGLCVFTGYVDLQSLKSDENGETEFIYARSSACLLVDNEAQQIEYHTPCAASLFYVNALPFGFKNGLKNHSINSDYRISKGTSCYGAINSFVKAFENRAVAVSPDGTLYVPSGKEDYVIDPDKILSEKRTVNRGSVISRIDYKTDGGYIHHRKSRFFEDKNICRSRQMNLSALPEWQRSTALSNRLRNSANGYCCAEIKVDGIVTAELYSPVICSGYENYYISSLHTVFNGKETLTAIGLRKQIELREADYVD